MPGTRLLESLLQQYLIQKPGDEVQHASPIIGKIIINKC
ncbi:hypothetical protein ASZ90_009265 [hydrocarbon metagenome]|uniref:Uncharacterized protein n=1 Tax=hydrocarbon metagenome TaxID=938273 RepID=A0A0W8FEB2_9ZZZZ